MMLRSSSFALTQLVDNHTDGSFVDHCRSAPSQLLTRIALAGLMASVSATAVTPPRAAWPLWAGRRRPAFDFRD